MTAGRLEHNQSHAKANVERAPAEDDEERLRREVNGGERRHEDEAGRWKMRSSTRGSSCMLTRAKEPVTPSYLIAAVFQRRR